MSNNGWIPLYRSIRDWKFSKDLEMVGLWAHFLTSANHEDGYDRDGNIVKKGSFRTGRKILANDFGLSESKVERMIKKLIKSGEIEQQTFRKYRVISITNWGKYQLSGQQTDNRRTTSEQQPDTNNKKEKKEKNKINKESPTPTECVEIINHLNLKTGKNFKPNTKATQRVINARLSDGYLLEDFKKVIAVKCEEWRGTDMEKHLCPTTLFGPKFEKYVNQSFVTSHDDHIKAELDAIFEGVNGAN